MDRLEELDDAIGAEKDLRARVRMLAVRAVLKLGDPVSHVAEVFGVTSRCVRLWIERFKSRGPGGLQDGPRSGRPPTVLLNSIRKIRGALRSEKTADPMGNIFTCFATWKNAGLDHLAEMAKYV